MLTRTLPLVVLAAVAFGVGIYESGASGRAQRAVVLGFVRALQHRDYRAMYAMLSPPSRARLSEATLHSDYAGADATATVTSVRDGPDITITGSHASVPFVVHTRVFGTLREPLYLPLTGSGGGTRVVFGSTLLFPGLRPGEELRRNAVLGSRGTLLAADGTPLAEGPARTSPIPEVANAVAGSLGPIPAAEVSQYTAQGYPPGAQVGQNGLELIFQRRLAGRPGGTLLAGKRVLANAPAKSGTSVRTTIEPRLEQAAIDAIGSAYGGITAMNPRTGAVEAAAGIAFTDVQPPGSTMKIITATAALQYGLFTLNSEFPVESSVYLYGFKMQNAGGEACGGTLLDAFAQSCDTVFAPIGAQLGAQRLVSTAEKFGFNQPTGVAGALESTIPPVSMIGDPLAVGSSAIGQGMVQASTLGMADVGATIADGGRRPLPSMLYGAKPRFVNVTTRKVAGEVQTMMEAVVQFGTGTPAQIPGVEVAGKTGTAELSNTANQQNNTKATDAWFVGYAPAGAPKLVACALFPNAGYGADTAAPAVRSVLETALGL